MPTISRSIYMYHLGITLYKSANISVNACLIGEINKVLRYILGLTEFNRKIDYPRIEKVLFLEASTKDAVKNTYNLQFISAKYNQVREVIDTVTLARKGKLKLQRDGDRERTHLSISFEDKDNAICGFEFNSDGVGMGKLIAYLNDMAEAYYKSIGKTRFYRFDHEILPNDDFLTTLSKMNKITIATFFVDKKNLGSSDFKDMASRNDVRDEVEIAIKPKDKGLSILSKTVKDYYEKKNKSHVIKRIVALGNDNKGPVRLDTEAMKTKHSITVEIDATHEVKSSSIFSQLKDIMPEGYRGDELNDT